MDFKGWHNVNQLGEKEFTCWGCGKSVATIYGFFQEGTKRYIWVCPNCGRPNFFDKDQQIPGPRFGAEVTGVPTIVGEAYNEARSCFSAAAYTASALMCRKILMSIAVSQGADQNQSFARYVDWLASNGYVPPHGKGWVDHIRDKGNEATHEIPSVAKVDAEELISFVEMLLKFIFEFPSRIASKT